MSGFELDHLGESVWNRSEYGFKESRGVVAAEGPALSVCIRYMQICDETPLLLVHLLLFPPKAVANQDECKRFSEYSQVRSRKEPLKLPIPTIAYAMLTRFHSAFILA